MKTWPDNKMPELSRVSLKKQESANSGSPAKHIRKRTLGPFIAELVFCTVLIAAICALPTVQIYASNVNLISFGQLGDSMWLYMGAGILVFSVMRMFIRKPYFAGLFVAFGVFFAVNLIWLVNFMNLFFNEYSSSAVGGLILYVLLLAGFFFVLRFLYKKKFPLNAVVKILSVTFTGLVVLNIVLAFIAVGKIKSNSTQVAAVKLPEATVSVTGAAPTPAVKTNADNAVLGSDPGPFGKPNIYFFILDEFSSFDMLQKYYGYDAKPLNDFLTMKGFNISRESYSTDNQTEHSFCDLFNLNYISRNLSEDDCIKGIQNGSLHKVLSGLGYTEYQIGNSEYFKGMYSLIGGDGADNPEFEDADDNTVTGDFGSDDVTSGGTLSGIIDALLSSDVSGTKVDTTALNQFRFYPSDYIRNSNEYKSYLRKSGVARSKLKVGDFMLTAFDYFREPSNYLNIAAPRVIYCYLLATHVPFLFDEYGGIIPYSQNRNWQDKNVYLNQYKFVSKELIATISAIIDNDPESVIIIMSDHGVRYHAESGLRLKMNFVITDKDSCRIMNAVYIKGQKYDIEGLSAINTLRFILNLYDGQNTPPIDDPINSGSPDCLRGIIPKSRHS